MECLSKYFEDKNIQMLTQYYPRVSTVFVLLLGRNYLWIKGYEFYFIHPPNFFQFYIRSIFQVFIIKIEIHREIGGLVPRRCTFLLQR